MATLTLDYPRPTTHRPRLLPLLLILLAATIAISAHAITKHGEEAQRVHDCIQRGGSIQTWYNPYSDRYLELCELEPGLYGIQISVKHGFEWRQVTSFIKNRLHRLDLVERYLENSGAYKIWPK